MILQNGGNGINDNNDDEIYNHDNNGNNVCNHHNGHNDYGNDNNYDNDNDNNDISGNVFWRTFCLWKRLLLGKWIDPDMSL